MKKFTLAFSLLFAAYSGFSQVNSLVEAPLNDNSASSLIAPNGSAAHTSFNACFLVPQSELFNIPSGTSITSFGYTLFPNTSTSASGNFTVYLQNTADITYQKGTAFGTAITGMTSVFANVMTLPLSATTTSVVVTLSTPFNYTGGGLYVACNWTSSGPFSTAGATFLEEKSAFPLPAGGGATSSSTLSAPPTMTLTNARPSFLFGFANAHTNDVQVIAVEAPGKLPATFSTTHQIKAYVRNASNTALSNIPVNLNVSGANVFSNTQTITTLAAGAGTLITFSPFTPLNLGLNTLSVSVASDQNNLNNSATYSQSITCNTWAKNPAAGNYTINSLGFNGASGIIAMSYSISANASLAGLRGAISTTTLNLNQPVCGVLLDASGTILATTNTITITSGIQGTFQNFSFSSPQSLTAGTTYNIGFMQLTPSSFPAGTLASYYQSTNLYSYTGITGGPLTLLTTNYGYLGIEAVLGNTSNNVIIASTPSNVCIGSCASLSVSALTNYTWSIGSTGLAINVCPTVTATYSVAGTTTLGCPATASISLLVYSLPNISISSSTTGICAGAPVSFTASGANTYSWDTGEQTAINTQSPTTGTTYTATGIDGNGCVNTSTVNIPVYTLTLTVSSNTTVCKGKSTTLLATTTNTDGYTYNWAIGNGYPFPNPSVSPTITTVYSVTATDINGCTQSNTVMVTVNPVPSVSVTSGKPAICKGESVTLTASGAITYSWSNTMTTSAITVTPQLTTSYVVMGTNSLGCSNSASFSQTVNLCTGLSEQALSNSSVRIFPNPNNGIFNLHCDPFQQARHIEVYNALGSMISRQEMHSEKTVLDISTAPNGIYFVQTIENNRPIETSKIIKQ